MNIFQAIILGLVQGITEFLPISSTAHLVLVPAFLGWSLDPALRLVFHVLVQMGTTLAVIAYFWGDWVTIFRSVVLSLWQRSPDFTSRARLGLMIALATIPAVLFGLYLKEFFALLLGNSRGVALLLMFTAGLLVLGEQLSGKDQRALCRITWLDAIIIGLFQALAILPGISRSGATISGGLLRGLDRSAAARFSFLMAVPVMLGAGTWAGRELLSSESLTEHLLEIAVGCVVAAAVGFMSIHLLVGYLKRHSLYGFAVYCTAVGILALLSGCSAVSSPTVGLGMRVGVTPATYALAEYWTKASPHGTEINLVEYSSNRHLLKAVESGGVTAGIAIHKYSFSNLSLKATPLAMTTLVVIVHPSNPVQEISGEQLDAAFTGTVINWKDLGGLSREIQIVSREDGSDARLAFDAQVLNGRHPDASAVVMPGDVVMADYVARTLDAIGYAWMPFVEQDVKSLVPEEGFLQATPVQAVTYEHPSGALREWLAWVQSKGQAGIPYGFEPMP